MVDPAPVEEAAAYHGLRLLAPESGFPMRIRLARPLADEELYRLCAANPELRIERSPDGELLILPPTGGRTGMRNLELSAQLATWAKQQGGGVAFDSSTGFVLPNGAERSPDAAWITNDRWHSLTEEQQDQFVPLCPDFVVELRSKTDDLGALQTKLDEYMANGARLGWLIDPKQRAVHVYVPGREPLRLEQPESLSGEPVLPGFTLQLAGIL